MSRRIAELSAVAVIRGAILIFNILNILRLII